MKNKICKIIMSFGLACVLASNFVACSDPAPANYKETGNTVKFDFNDGFSRPYSIVADDNESVDQPDTPVRAGYAFEGWFTEKDGSGTKVTFPYTPSSDETFYAKWNAETLTVTLDYNYNGKVERKEVDYGTAFQKPDAPERDGFTLFSWRKNSADGNEVTFPFTVKKDVTLVADWVNSADVFVVNFDFNYDGAEKVDGKTVVKGEAIKESDWPATTRIGYKLQGWSLTPDGKTLKFPYKPTESCTLYAIWKEQTYEVAYWTNYVDNDEMFATDSAKGGATINAPKGEPTRKDYEFIGWYTSTEGGEQINFPYQPVRDTSIYAHWKHIPVDTDIFHAEYVEFDPNELFPGYSGENRGKSIIGSTTSRNIEIDKDFPLSKAQQAAGHKGYYVTYLYKRGATLSFVINSSAAVSNATLQVSVAIEGQSSATFGPTGKNAWKVAVNGTALNYTAFSLSIAGKIEPSSMSDFKLFTLGNISLKEGENVIELVTDNDNSVIGGTTRANAPMVDYIKLTNYGSATLSWSPVYDNLY